PRWRAFAEIRLVTKPVLHYQRREVHEDGLNAIEQDVVRMPVLQRQSGTCEVLEKSQVEQRRRLEHRGGPLVRIADERYTVVLEHEIVRELGICVLSRHAGCDHSEIKN